MQSTAAPNPDAALQVPDEAQRTIARLRRRSDIGQASINHLNQKIALLEDDVAEEERSHKETAQRAENLQKALLHERAENDKLRAQVQELQAEGDALRTKLSERDTLQAKPSESAILSPVNATRRSSQSDGALQQQLHILQRRYDELQTVKLRAEERYKADYRKFHSVKVSMRSEEIQQLQDDYRADYPNLSKDERKRRRREINALIERKALELEASYVGDNSALPTVIISQRNKENQQTPVPETPKSQVASSPFASIPSSPIGVIPIMKLHPLLEIKAQPLPRFILSRAPPASLASDGGKILIPNSSDTEERPYPGSDPFASLEITPIALVVRPALPLSSDTDDDSQGAYPLFRVPPVPAQAHPPPQHDRKPLRKQFATSTPRPNPINSADRRLKKKPRHSDGSTTSSAPRVDPADEPPLKKRRVSSPGPARRISISEPGASAATPLYIGSGDTPRRKRDRDPGASTGRRLKDGGKDKGKGKQRALQVKMETSTPVTTAINARASSSKQLADYSGFKGRGRYANDGAGGNTTINAKFQIDSAQNGGRDFQYDEVVRGREKRRQMEAGDCESCRDYYEAIGPMPNRLQAPLWRTPPGSPSGPKQCPHIGAARTSSADITSHKQAISRHRHHWERGKTPPSYWNIGFPDTQQAAKINEEAREMHQQKQKDVQREANREGGRYKKR
ncbi:hypothetical protein C8R46DRAFT_1053135 [Mycena filopes]|nr:hypothetical protein C8R46DRAFT_1053135 [Mycena filopes]